MEARFFGIKIINIIRFHPSPPSVLGFCTEYGGIEGGRVRSERTGHSKVYRAFGDSLGSTGFLGLSHSFIVSEAVPAWT